MVLSKYIAVCALLVSFSICWSPAAQAQGHCAGGMCRHGMPHHRCLEVGCAPKRAVFNYYPTTWRRWPTDASAATPTPAATTPDASQPTPAEQETQPQVQPEQPLLAPDDETILPGGDDAETTQPAPPPLPAEEEMLPWQDLPPELPGESPSEPGLPGLPSSNTPLVPEDAPPEPSSPMDDAPPTMPDDNPFRDDPIQPESQSPGSTGRNDAGAPTLSAYTSSDGMSWRSPSRGGAPAKLPAAPIAKSLVAEGPRVAPSLASPYPIAPEAGADSDSSNSAPAMAGQLAPDAGPRLLPPADEAADEPETPVLPETAPARRNPLRMAGMDASAGRVVAAAWTVQESKPAASTVNSRRNPLRDN